MDVSRILIDYKDRYFKNYLSLIESAVKKEYQKYDKENKKFLRDKKNLSERDVYFGEEHFIELWFDICKTEQLLYRSFILSMFIFIEQEIIELCDSLFKKNKGIFCYKDLSGQGISRGIIYLEKKLNHKFPKSDDTRNKFKILHKIRNAIVHNNAKIIENDKIFMTQQIKNNNRLLKIDKYNEIILNYEYALDIINLYKGIYKETFICRK